MIKIHWWRILGLMIQISMIIWLAEPQTPSWKVMLTVSVISFISPRTFDYVRQR